MIRVRTGSQSPILLGAVFSVDTWGLYFVLGSQMGGWHNGDSQLLEATFSLSGEQFFPGTLRTRTWEQTTHNLTSLLGSVVIFLCFPNILLYYIFSQKCKTSKYSINPLLEENLRVALLPKGFLWNLETVFPKQRILFIALTILSCGWSKHSSLRPSVMWTGLSRVKGKVFTFSTISPSTLRIRHGPLLFYKAFYY